MTEENTTVEISYVPDEEAIEETPEKKETDVSCQDPHKKHHTRTGQKRLKELEDMLAAAITERDESKDKYLRTLAEMDNFRKRVQREKEEFQKYALSEFLLDLLLIFDNLDRALKACTQPCVQGATAGQENGGSEKSIVSGVSMISKQFQEILKKNNVMEIEALNKVFDPNLHQALSREERENLAEPMVVEVYQKGFLYNGKLLKPSLVKVAIPVEEEIPIDTEEEKKE